MKICQYCDSAMGDEVQLCPNCGSGFFLHHCDQCGEVFDSAFCPRCGLKAGTRAKTCPECAARYHSAACPNCGYMPGRSPAARVYVETVPAVSPKSRLAALVLALLLGIFGIHRFYAGKIGTGILYLLTGGLGGIGVFFDVVLILFGSFKDGTGLPLKNW
jgi:RNA polymerase subunit RPABC4/transcription elongation factor Spt4